MTPNPTRASALIRNFTFGVEDSLSSSVGLLTGIASAQMGTPALIITGFILIFIEALSMGIGSFLSDQSANQYQTHHSVSTGSSLPGAVVMFVSYFVSGFIPLGPYILFPRNIAFPVSIFASLLALLLLGIFNAYLARTSIFKNSLRMLLFGGVVIAAGVVAGRFLQNISF